MNGTGGVSATTAASTAVDDRRQLAISAAVCSGLAALAFWRPPAGRRALGILFALTGLAWNGILTGKAPSSTRCWPAGLPAWYRRIGRP